MSRPTAACGKRILAAVDDDANQREVGNASTRELRSFAFGDEREADTVRFLDREPVAVRSGRAAT